MTNLISSSFFPEDPMMHYVIIVGRDCAIVPKICYLINMPLRYRNAKSFLNFTFICVAAFSFRLVVECYMSIKTDIFLILLNTSAMHGMKSTSVCSCLSAGGFTPLDFNTVTQIRIPFPQA